MKRISKNGILSPGYSVEIDKVNAPEWTDLLKKFDDASIYQTWPYGSIRWGENNLSHLVLKKNGEIVAAAQLRIIRFPFIGKGIAYMPWGPVWRLHEKEEDVETIRHMIRAIVEEYVVRRGLLLRVAPNEIEHDGKEIRSILEAKGFYWESESYRTILLDLRPSIEELRKKLNPKWRNQLNGAEKNELKLIEGTDNELYDTFVTLYNEMLKRKGFTPGVDVYEFRKIQNDLPDALKMKAMICESKGKPVSALIGSLIGHKGIYLLGATGEEGLKLKSSYLLQWQMIQWLKGKGSRWYDLGGIDPEENPGVYHFKEGLGGVDIKHIGQFEASRGLFSSLLVKYGEKFVKILTNVHL